MTRNGLTKETENKCGIGGNVFLRLFSAWCAAAVVLKVRFGASFTEPSSFLPIRFVTAAAVFSAAFVVLEILRTVTDGRLTDGAALCVLFGAYTGITVYENPDIVFILLLSALWAILLFYLADTGSLCIKYSPGKKTAVSVVAAAAVLFTAVIGARGVLRFRTFSTPNFDFGIFCNMFYNMRERFVPLCTCERDVLLSHFAIHISPVFYLLLPVYFIFPRPETLQICQAAVLASACIPLCLIARLYRLNYTKTAAFGLLLLLYPAVGNGTNYDFHENCFLLPFLLWMFYFFEKDCAGLTFLFAALTMCVKEDAAVYIMVFALYVTISGRRPRSGVFLLMVSFVCFTAEIFWLTKHGDGAMIGRYANFMPDGSITSAIKTLFADPAYVLTQLLSDGEAFSDEKLLYITQMLSPLCFLPVCCKKPTRLLLLLPMLFFNLMTLYIYQYDIGFQYSFGSGAFLFYMAVMNTADMKNTTAKAALCTGLILSLMIFCITSVTDTARYAKLYLENRVQYAEMEEFLSDLPENVCTVSSSMLLPCLAARDRIYEDYYHTPDGSEEMIVADMRYNGSDTVERYEALGYKVTKTFVDDSIELIKILERNSLHFAS